MNELSARALELNLVEDRLPELGDRLGELQVSAQMPKNRWDCLRFYCHTCVTESRQERNAYPWQYDKPWNREELEEQGAMVLPFSGGEANLVLPFDQPYWRSHLLHEVRAEWDMAWISNRSLIVQDLRKFSVMPLKQWEFSPLARGR